jgi:hypothetical protein
MARKITNKTPLTPNETPAASQSLIFTPLVISEEQLK